MKKKLFKASMIICLAGLALMSCKKDKEPNDDTVEQTTNGGDDSRVQLESDAVINDADLALSGNTATMRTATATSICGATIDSTNKASGVLTINYDGVSTCNGRTRSGSVTLTLVGNANWSDASAVLMITFNNLVITRVSDSKSITFSGTKYITNVNGGLVATLASGSGSVVHRIKSTNMQITFDDGTARTWGIARTRTITRQSSTAYTITTVGDSTVSGVSGVAAAGTTRTGSPFYSKIETPVVWNTAVCSYAPISGSRILKGLVREITITYGVDVNGNAVSGTCAYGTKLNWTNLRGQDKTVIVIY